MKLDIPPSSRPGVSTAPASASPRAAESVSPPQLPLPFAAGGLGLGYAAAAALVSALVAAAVLWLGPSQASVSGWILLAAAIGAVVGCGVGVWGLRRSAFESQRRAVAAALQRSAAEGPAIGVPRSMFMELSIREWSRARRYGAGAALLLIEIDRHEALRQTHGSAAVDAVMAEMLRLTAPTLRGADVLTRFGPVQMAIFLVQADATGTLDVAERVRERTERLEVLFQSSGFSKALVDAPTLPLPLSLTVSIGVAHLRPAHLQLQALIDDAEDALAMARLAGGNCVRAAPVDAEPRTAPDAWRGDRRTQPK